MIFPYKQYPAGIIRPVIPVTLKAGGLAIEDRCLVDSGADNCIFSLEVARALKLRLKSGRKVEFQGFGKASGYWHNIEIQVGDSSYKATAVFADLKSLNVGILGQQGFFDHFDVTLSYKDQSVELKSI